MAVDREAALRWINMPPTRRQRAGYILSRIHHHSMPHILDGPISLWNLLSTFLSIISAVGVLTSPFWVGLFLEESLPTALAVKAAIAIAALRLIGWFAPKLRALNSEHAANRKSLDIIATRHVNIVRELFREIPEDCLPKDHQWRLRLTDRMVSCMHHIAQHHLGKEAGEIQCSYLGFEKENEILKVKVLSRARDIRNSSAKVTADQTISYYVAESGRYFVVNDLKRQRIFPYKGLSEPKAKYRSIMLIPVIVDSTNGRACVGVVTIDSPRPCEFWDDIGDSLATQLMPFIHILTFVMNNGSAKVTVKEA